MKKIFTLLFVFSALSFAFAQTLPNNGFETWTNATTPTNWAANYSGTVSGAIPLSFSFGTRTVDAHSGSYALKISPTLMPVGNITMPGFVQLGAVGSFNIDLATLTALSNLDFSSINPDSLGGLRNMISKGVPMSNSPSEVKFWYKFLPDGSDEAMINVMTTKWNSLTNSSEIVASGSTTISGLATQYTEMNVPMTLEGANSTCDTILVIIVAGGAQASAATEFFIDDITLKFNTWGVNEFSSSDVNVYPNPAKEVATITVKDYTQPYQISLYDSFGKLLFSTKDLNEAYSFSTVNYSTGIYLVKITQNGLTTTTKLMVE
jgi:hypothetical protein